MEACNAIRAQYGYGGQRGPGVLLACLGSLSAVGGLRARSSLAGLSLSLSLCLSHLVLLCPVGLVRHWPNSARLKHTKHQGGSPRRFVCPPVVRVAFRLRCAIGDGRGVCYLYPSGAGPGGRDRYYVVHMRWAVPCLQLRIVRRASITMYCSTLQWFFYWHVVSAFVRHRMHCTVRPCPEERIMLDVTRPRSRPHRPSLLPISFHPS